MGVGWPWKCHQATCLVVTAPGYARVAQDTSAETGTEPWVATRCSPESLTDHPAPGPASAGAPGPHPSWAAKSYRNRPRCHSKAVYTSPSCSLMSPPHVFSIPNKPGVTSGLPSAPQQALV